MADEALTLDPFQRVVNINWGGRIVLLIEMQATDFSTPSMTVRVSGIDGGRTFNIDDPVLYPFPGLGAPPVVRATIPGNDVNAYPSQGIASLDSFSRYTFWRYYNHDYIGVYTPPPPDEGDPPAEDPDEGRPTYAIQAQFFGAATKCFPPIKGKPNEHGRLTFVSSAATAKAGGYADVKLFRVRKADPILNINGDFQLNFVPLPKQRVNVFDADFVTDARVSFNDIKGGTRYVEVNLKELTLTPDSDD